MSKHFASGGQISGASTSASVLPMDIQGCLPLGLTGLFSLLSKGHSREPSTTVQKHWQTTSVFLPCESHEQYENAEFSLAIFFSLQMGRFTEILNLREPVDFPPSTEDGPGAQLGFRAGCFLRTATVPDHPASQAIPEQGPVTTKASRSSGLSDCSPSLQQPWVLGFTLFS